MDKKKTNIVILGTGFIGTHLAHSLSQKPDFSVKVLFHTRAPSQEKSRDAATYVQGDICDLHSLRAVIEEGAVVVNCTGAVGRSEEELVKVNRECVKTVIKICQEKQAQKLIHLSSVSVYGDLSQTSKRSFKEGDTPKPVTTYGRIKLEAETLLQKKTGKEGVPTIILRLTNVYGLHGGGFISKVIDTVSYGNELVVYHEGKEIRDYIHVDDVVMGITRAITHSSKEDCEIYNLSINRGVTLNEIIQFFAARGPLRVKYENTNETALLTSVADNAKAKRYLGFNPRFELFRSLQSMLQ